MKKFDFVDDYLTKIQLTEAEMTAYQKYFQGKLRKWGIKSPMDLKDPAKKRAFYDDVKKGWNKPTK